MHVYKKKGTYVLRMVKMLEIIKASFEVLVTNLKIGVRQLQATYLARKKNFHLASCICRLGESF